MAWSHLQSVGNNNSGNGGPGGSVAATVATNLSSGSVLIAGIAVDTDNGTVVPLASLVTISDNHSNAFTFVGGEVSADNNVYVGLFALATPSGDVGTKPIITATLNASFDSYGIGMVVQEVSGISVTTDGSLVGYNAEGGPSWTCGTYSDTIADEYLVVLVGDGYGQSTFTASGFTPDANNQQSLDNIDSFLLYKNSSGGSETVTGAGSELSATEYYCSTIVAFKLAGGSGPTITTTSLPNAVIGKAYSATMVATGGTTPYTWSISVGSLPGWASLNTSTGAITGTPTGTPTLTSFTAKVTDNASLTATQALSIETVNSGILQSAWPGYPTPALFVPGKLISSGGVGPVQHNETLTGIVVTRANVTRNIFKSISGKVALAGTLTRKLAHTLSTALTLKETVTRQLNRILTAFTIAAGIIQPGFSFFDQMLPLGSLSTSVASTTDLGIQFNVTAPNYQLSGYYVYIPSGGDTTASNYTFALYSTTDGITGTQVGTTTTGSGTFTAAAWNYVSLGASPLTLMSGDTYVATYHLIANDPYQYVLAYWSVGLGSGGITSGPITAPGTGTALNGIQEAYNQPAGASIEFPTSNYMGAWYGIDVEVTGGVSAVMHMLTVAGTFIVNSVITRQVAKAVTGTTATTSTVTRQLARTLLGVLAVIGAVPRKVSRTITAGAVISAATIRRITRALLASVASTAAVTDMIGRILTAIVVATGVLGRDINKTVNAVIAVTSSVSRACRKSISSPVVLTSTLIRNITRILPASLAVTANVGIVKFMQLILIALAAVDAAVIRSVSRGVDAVIAVNSQLSRGVGRTLTGIIAVTVSVGQTKIKQVMLAALAAVNAVIDRSVTRTLTAPVVLTASVNRSLTHDISAFIAATANISRNISRTVNTVVVTVASLSTTKFKQVMLLTVSVVNTTVTRSTSRIVTAVTAVTAITTRAIKRSLSASVAATGTVFRNITRTFTGIIAAISVMSIIKFKQVILDTVIAVNAAITRSISRPVAASAAVMGTVRRFITRDLTVPVAFTALLSTGGLVYQVSLAAVISLTAVVGRAAGKLTVGTVTATATVQRYLSFHLNGFADVTAATVRKITRTVTAVIVTTASTSVIKAKFVTLTAMIVTEAAVIRMTGRITTATTTVTAATQKLLSFHLNAFTDITAVTVRNIIRICTATVTTTASLAYAKFKQVTLTVVTILTGTINRSVSRPLAATVVAAVNVVMKIESFMNTTVTAAVSVTRNITRSLAAKTITTAAVTYLKFKQVMLTAVVTTEVAISRITGYILAAGIVVPISCVRFLKRTISAAIILTGKAAKTIPRTLKTVFTVISAVSAESGLFFVFLTANMVVQASVSKLRNGPAIVFKAGIHAFRWVAGALTNNWKSHDSD